MSRDTFTAKYEIADGYCGGARPQSFRIDAGDISPDMTDDQLEQLFHDMAEEDMAQNHPSEQLNVVEFIAWARALPKGS